MPNFIELIYSLKGSYSGAFVLFWGLMLLVCIGLGVIERRNAQLSARVDSGCFWIFGSAMVAFAAFRPIGIARDDLAYLEIFKTVCPSMECGQWVQSARDWGWYSLVGFLKSFWAGPRVMLLVSATAALIKLWVIFKLSRRPMLALLFFTGVFYQVQDLTAFRVSLSLAVFMLAIYLLSRRFRVIGAISVFIPGLFHQQAVLSPLILLSGLLKRQYAFFVALVLAPICLLFLGGTFKAYTEILPFQDLPLLKPIIQQGIGPYIAAGQAGAYAKTRVMPYSFLPLMLLIVCFSREVFLTNKDLYRYSAMSFVITCWLIWFFAGWEEPQARFFEYFALPAVLLVGNFRSSWLSLLGVLVVAGVFVMRYNVLHPLLTG